MSEREKLEDIKEILRQSRDYRGQLFEFVTVDGREPKDSSLDDYPEPLRGTLESILKNEDFDIHYLYIHQGEAVKNLWENSNVFLCSNEGSGRSIAADLSSLITVILKHGTVLYILPNEADIASRVETFKKRIAKAKWNWLLNVSTALDAEELSLSISQSPDVIITSANAIRDYFLVQFTTAQCNVWFASLSLIVIEDINSYNPQELVHLRNLIRALRFRLSTGVMMPNILLTGTPVGSPEKIAYSLLGLKPVAIRTDYSPKNRYHLLFWIPTLESYEDEGLDINIKRASYTDEVVTAASVLCRSGGEYLVWHAFTNLSADELRKLRETAFERKSELRDLKIRFCHRLQELGKEDFRKFDGVLVLGLPPDLARIKDLLGNLLIDDGIAVVIPPEDPLSYYILRNPDNWESMRLPELYVGEFSSVTRYYLLRAMVSLPENRASVGILEEIWGEKAMGYLEPLIEEDVLTFSHDVVTVSDRNGVIDRAGNLRWGAVEEKSAVSFSFTRSDGRVQYSNFDTALFPWQIFEGAVFYRGNERFRINRLDISGREVIPISYASEGAPVLTVPKIETKIVEKREVNRKRSDFGEIHFLELEIEESLTGYKYFRSYSHPGREADISPPVSRTRNVSGLKIVSFPAHGLEHLVKIFLPMFIHSYPNLLSVISYEGTVYIYSLFPEDDEVIRYLFGEWEIFSEIVFQRSYELLKTCPCAEGCPQCLKIFGCTSDDTPDKAELLLALAKPLERTDEARVLIDFKKEGLSGKQADERYREWKKPILEAFENKLEMSIGKVVPLEVKWTPLSRPKDELVL